MVLKQTRKQTKMEKNYQIFLDFSFFPLIVSSREWLDKPLEGGSDLHRVTTLTHHYAALPASPNEGSRRRDRVWKVWSKPSCSEGIIKCT